jgi:hypothetical protein
VVWRESADFTGPSARPATTSHPNRGPPLSVTQADTLCDILTFCLLNVGRISSVGSLALHHLST